MSRNTNLETIARALIRRLRRTPVIGTAYERARLPFVHAYLEGFKYQNAVIDGDTELDLSRQVAQKTVDRVHEKRAQRRSSPTGPSS